jgi:ABC-type multidrug transport system ATPase subunit/pSer/pThr/pTyr-binding forkhead associated (FHA) protein
MAASPHQPRIVLIGRAPGNDIVLRSPGVSARHARVVVEPERLILEDLGSRNGTFVGSPPRRIDQCEISLTDTLTFGDTRLEPSALADLLARTRPRQAEEAIVLGDSAVVTIGRGARATAHVTSPVASSLHASFTLEDGRVVVRDLGSMTGTFVNGERIKRPVVIDPGTVVQVADTRYRLANDGRTFEPLEANGDAIELVSTAITVHGGRRLLEDVSLVIEPGELVAVMGPSGSGKSTLLSLVNGQVAPAAGKVLVGGIDLHDHFELFRGRIGFVPQDDILHADLTVWQALWYAARLRLPKDTTDAEIATRLRAVLAQLGLEGTEHTRVGDQRKRGVSGGQRKRVNLAMELLTDPPILVLDEPTSGLSSMDALSVIELLRSLADAGKTILVTIHQPSVDVFQLFDAVAVIARDASTKQVGRLAYFGRAWPDSVNFFEPRDDLAEPPATPDGLLRGLGTRPVAEWARRWTDSASRSIWVDARASGQAGTNRPHRRQKPRPVAKLSQWATLVARNLAVKASDRWNTAVLLLQAPVAAILITLVFSRVLRTDPTVATWAESGARMATAMFVTALAAIWFGVSGTAREIVTEWPVYRRERMVGLSILSYLCSKITVLAGVAAVQTAMLLVVVGPGCGLLGSWWHAWLMLFAAALVGGAIGLVISASLSTAEAAAGVLPILLLPMIVLGGILVPLGDLPAMTRPLAAATPSRWAFEGLVVPEALARPRVRRVEAEPEATTAVPSRQRVPIITVAGKKKNFILPGRRKIAETLEDAAAKAEAELRRAEREANQKAEAMQRQTEAEMEKRAAAMRRETEEAVRRAMEESKAEVEATIEARMNEANESIEKRLREMQEGMETERARMQKVLDMVERPGELVPPSAEIAASEVDMAEQFFPKASSRSPAGTPLLVLSAMAALGFVTAGIVLARRDA